MAARLSDPAPSDALPANNVPNLHERPVAAPAESLASLTLVPAGADWRYLDNGTDQGTAWRDLAFDDSNWAAGPAELGYGDGDEATVVSYGPNPNSKYTTTYFRHAFNLADVPASSSLLLSLLRDDGAVVYLNGEEVFRSNMPAGTVTYTTPATQALGPPLEYTNETASLDPALLAIGDNLLAVEIHQANGTSSDLSFDLSLEGVPNPPACEPVDVRFAVIGDFGMDNQAEADVATMVNSWNPDFVITTGDNNYPAGAADTIDQNIGRHYQQFIGNYQGSYGPGASSNNFYPSLGNHDWATQSEGLPIVHNSYFTLPGNERYYSFVRGPVEFFAVDSDPAEPDGIASNSTQAAWLQPGLAASESPWRVVYFHHPPYSSGAHGSTPGLQWPFLEWGASVVLSGHEHSYERLHVGGLTYFVNGLGGADPRPFGPAIAGSAVRYYADYGAQLVDANAGCLDFKFISRAGAVIDSYTLLEELEFLPVVVR
jgi:hypothetical protein